MLIEKNRLEQKHKLMKKHCMRVRMKKKSNDRKKQLTLKLIAIGKMGEEKIMKLLKQKYPDIQDNNIENEYSTMDFTDDTKKMDFEIKNRCKYNHDEFDKSGYIGGLMYGKNKFDYIVKRHKLGYKHKVFWICKNGIFYWSIYDPEKQKDQYTFGNNCNKDLGQRLQEMVYVKIKYLKKLQ